MKAYKHSAILLLAGGLMATNIAIATDRGETVFATNQDNWQQQYRDHNGGNGEQTRSRSQSYTSSSNSGYGRSYANRQNGSTGGGSGGGHGRH